MIRIAICIGMLLELHAFSVLPHNERYKKAEPAKKVVKNDKANNIDRLLEKMGESATKLRLLDKKISQKTTRKDYRPKRTKTTKRAKPIVIENNASIPPLTEMSGIINDSVLATSVWDEVVVYVSENETFPEGAKLGCRSKMHGKRAKIHCNTIVERGREISVDVILKDPRDGVASIFCDSVHDGSDEKFIKQAYAAFLGASFDTMKDTYSTSEGLKEKISLKNKTIDGLMNISKKSYDKEATEYTSLIGIIDAGRTVTILFRKGVKDA